MFEHYFNIVIYFFSNWDYSFIMIPLGSLFFCFALWLISKLIGRKRYAR